MKSLVVRRGVLLALLTGSADVFIRTLPQMADQHSNQTGSPLHRPGSKLETGKLDRKVVVKPQTSPKSRPRVQREVIDNYCVLNVAEVKDSVHVSGKKEDLNPSPVTSNTVFLHVNSCVANVYFIALIPPNIATGPAKRQKKTSCIYYRQDRSQSVHSPGGARYFISCLPIDVIASFSFGAKECAEDFLQRYVFEVLQRTLPRFLFFISTE